MRRLAVVFLASTAMTLGVSAGSSAADIPYPTKARPVAVAPAPYNWTGLYVGGHLGAGWARNRVSDREGSLCSGFDGFCLASLGLGSDLGSHNALGVLAGGQVGINYQVGRSLFGIEGQYSWADLKGDHENTVTAATTFGGDGFANTAVVERFSSHVRSLGTIAGRIGIVSDPNDRTLFYLKGGAAFAKTTHGMVGNSSSSGCFFLGCFGNTSVANLSANDTRWGWMAGIGLEYGLADNWSAKVEYNYMDFGRKDVTLTGIACSSFDPCAPASRDVSIDQTMHVVKFGVNYRFSAWGAGR